MKSKRTTTKKGEKTIEPATGSANPRPLKCDVCGCGLVPNDTPGADASDRAYALGAVHLCRRDLVRRGYF